MTAHLEQLASVDFALYRAVKAEFDERRERDSAAIAAFAAAKPNSTKWEWRACRPPFPPTGVVAEAFPPKPRGGNLSTARYAGNWMLLPPSEAGHLCCRKGRGYR